MTVLGAHGGATLVALDQETVSADAPTLEQGRQFHGRWSFRRDDAYLFVMCSWTQKNGLPLPDPLPAFVARMKARPAVRQALEEEGLAEPAAS